MIPFQSIPVTLLYESGNKGISAVKNILYNSDLAPICRNGRFNTKDGRMLPFLS